MNDFQATVSEREEQLRQIQILLDLLMLADERGESFPTAPSIITVNEKIFLRKINGEERKILNTDTTLNMQKTRRIKY